MFYYVVLTTSGEASPPSFSAWSVEALMREVAEHRDEVDELDLKWSYGDSPYFCYHQENFSELKTLFLRRPRMNTSMTDSEWNTEYELRFRALECALKELDDEGLFGVGEERRRIVINVEVMPPDRTNTERAKRLNPPDCLLEWLAENDQS